jgi:hypothetical protein
MPARQRKNAGLKSTVTNIKSTATPTKKPHPNNFEETEGAFDNTRRKVKLSKSNIGIAGVIAAIAIVVTIAFNHGMTNATRYVSSTEISFDGTPLPDPDSSSRQASSTSPPPRVSKIGSFELLETVPHDPSAFTQGLFIWNDTLYEGTGNYGQSNLRIVDIISGNVL